MLVAPLLALAAVGSDAMEVATAPSGTAFAAAPSGDPVVEVDPRLATRSVDGRWEVLTTLLALDAADTNGARDVYLVDRELGRSTLVSRAAGSHGGRAGDGDSFEPTLTPDGRHIAFWSCASDLVDGDRNGLPDVFLARVNLDSTGAELDRISLVSTDALGGAAGDGSDGASTAPSVSADGRHVAFVSRASNLVEADANGHVADVFLAELDPSAGRVHALTLVSTDRFTPWCGNGANGPSRAPRVSEGGARVEFVSSAGDLARGDRNGNGTDRFVAHLDTGAQGLCVTAIERLEGPGERFFGLAAR